MQQIQTIRCEGQPIPRESQLLRLLAASTNKSAMLRLETKSIPGQSAASARAWARRIATPVVEAGLTSRVIMQDFDWDGIAGYHSASPALRVSALIARPTTADVDRAAALGAYDLSYDAASETSDLDAYIVSKRLVPTVRATDAVPARSGAPSKTVTDAAVAAFTHAVCAGARVVIMNDPSAVLAARAKVTCS